MFLSGSSVVFSFFTGVYLLSFVNNIYSAPAILLEVCSGGWVIYISESFFHEGE